MVSDTGHGSEPAAFTGVVRSYLARWIASSVAVGSNGRIVALMSTSGPSS